MKDNNLIETSNSLSVSIICVLVFFVNMAVVSKLSLIWDEFGESIPITLSFTGAILFNLAAISYITYLSREIK